MEPIMEKSELEEKFVELRNKTKELYFNVHQLELEFANNTKKITDLTNSKSIFGKGKRAVEMDRLMNQNDLIKAKLEPLQTELKADIDTVNNLAKSLGPAIVKYSMSIDWYKQV